MSRLVQTRRGGKSATVVSGSLSGSSSLSIPQGAELISLTGRGGDGGNNYWYDPGQPYMPPLYSGWGGPFTAPGSGSTGGLEWAEAMTQNYSGGNSAGPSEYGTTSSPPGAWTASGYSWNGTNYTWTGYYWTPRLQSSGQPYIAPSSGGGPYYGSSTTATLNGTTRTWTGGYDSGVQGTTSTQTITSTGAGQTMTYSIPGTGSLTYTYEY